MVTTGAMHGLLEKKESLNLGRKEHKGVSPVTLWLKVMTFYLLPFKRVLNR